MKNKEGYTEFDTVCICFYSYIQHPLAQYDCSQTLLLGVAYSAYRERRYCELHMLTLLLIATMSYLIIAERLLLAMYQCHWMDDEKRY